MITLTLCSASSEAVCTSVSDISLSFSTSTITTFLISAVLEFATKAIFVKSSLLSFSISLSITLTAAVDDAAPSVNSPSVFAFWTTDVNDFVAVESSDIATVAFANCA